MKRVFYLVAAVVLMCSCAEKEQEEKPGSISGTVTDKATSEPIRAAGVRLNTGETAVTGNDGFYEFPTLKAGEYTMQVTKTGYSDLTGYNVTVSAGKNVPGNVQLEKLPPSLRIVNADKQDIEELNFGDAAADLTRSFNIFNDGPEPLEWEIVYTAAWITGISKESGKLNAGATQAIVVTIDREQLDGGGNTTTIHITSDNGSKQLTVTTTGEVKILATLNTHAATNITTTTAMLNGEILTDGTPTYTERGFVYSLSPMPTLETTIAKVTASLTASKTYSATASGLTLGQTYYVRAYATNKTGTAYSTNEVSFKTTMVLPTITTQEVTNRNIAAGMVTFNGTIISGGDPNYTERGFVYGLVHNPTIENDIRKQVSGTGLDMFSSNLTELTEGNVYYVRAYATNALGTSYGSEVVCDFNAIIPIVTTQEVSNIGATSATFNGTIVNAGDPVYTERGFVYATANNPTINDDKIVEVGNGNGIFNTNISELITGITYYVRAYTIDKKGTAHYGQSVSFTASHPDCFILSEAGIMVQKADISNGTTNWEISYNLCRSSTVGGYTNWRIPTLNELNVIYNNRNTIGGFNNSAWYWTSSLDTYRSSSDYYYQVHFGSGSTSSDYYRPTFSYNYRCRCVRNLP